MAVHGQRYLADRTLAELEGSLNAREFIRDNRPFLVRISAIVPFGHLKRGRSGWSFLPRQRRKESYARRTRRHLRRGWGSETPRPGAGSGNEYNSGIVVEASG
jgi:hypothetical protein